MNEKYFFSDNIVKVANNFKVTKAFLKNKKT